MPTTVGFPVVARFIGRWCPAMNRRTTSCFEFPISALGGLNIQLHESYKFNEGGSWGVIPLIHR